jgi:mannose-6-phosphate isomerase-like protein (cupin superfamily)
MSDEKVVVLDATDGPELAIVDGPGRAWAVVWPGVGARLRSLHRIDLESGARTVELAHTSDAVYYVWRGSGAVADGAGADGHDLRVGSMVHVDAGTAYVLAAGDDGMQLIGGPAPADAELYERYLVQEG